MQLAELWPLAKFHAQIWQFWELARISETAARRAKLSSVSTPWGRKRVALLDYVSRAHEIEIRPSVVRLWHPLSLKLLYGFLSNFSSGFPWTVCPDVFFIFEKKLFWFFLRIFFKLQNSTTPTNRSWKFSNFSRIFFLMVLTKQHLGFLKFWKLKF